MYSISPLYQIIHFNVSILYLKPLNTNWDRTPFKGIAAFSVKLENTCVVWLLVFIVLP